MGSKNKDKPVLKPSGERPDPVDIHVGAKLKLQRTLKGLSQEKLAEATGITFQQIQKYERGTNRISASRLYQFSKILSVPVSFFFEHYKDNAKGAPVLGLADNEQDSFEHGPDGNIMEKKETIELIRTYYSIPDPKLRKELMKVLKTMAKTMNADS